MKKLEKLCFNNVEPISKIEQSSIVGGGIWVTGPDGQQYWYVGEVEVSAFASSDSYWGSYFNNSNYCYDPNYEPSNGSYICGSNVYELGSNDGSCYNSYPEPGGGGGGSTGFYVSNPLYSVVLAQGYLGNTPEWAEGANPAIMAFFNSTTYQATDDSDPWCSAFVNFIMESSNRDSTNSAAAISWLNWGTATSTPALGDVAVFENPDPNGYDHVGIVSRIENGVVYMISGNSGNNVEETVVSSDYVFRTNP